MTGGNARFYFSFWQNPPVDLVVAWARRRIPAEELRAIRRTVEDLVEEVRTEGDAALLRHISRYDGWDPRPEDLKVEVPEPDEVRERLGDGLPEDTWQSLEVCRRSIEEYHQNDVPRDWLVSSDTGSAWGRVYRPVSSVGIYVPGGRYPYVSTVLMTAIPAAVAGCETIVVCTPGMPAVGEGGRRVRTPAPAFLAAASLAGVREIYLVGGASAIAAMAFGTETVRKVEKVVGPGNVYVTLAKKMVLGEAGIDVLAGPSELVVFADESAEPDLVSRDMLSQVEHDDFSWAVALTASPKVAKALAEELASEGGIEVQDCVPTDWHGPDAALGGARQGGRCQCLVALMPDDGTALAAINAIAPEHLQIIHRRAEGLLPEITAAGAIYVGEYTPTAVGDYCAGPSHVLPTGGSARYSSGIGVATFLRSSTFCRLTAADFQRLGTAAARMAEIEGMDLHRRALEIRLKGRS